MLKRLSLLMAAVLCAWQLFGCSGRFDNVIDHFRNDVEAEYLTEAEAEERPFYQQLNNNEKAVYTAIYRGVLDHADEVRFSETIDGETYAKIYTMILRQESALFYMDYSYNYAKKLNRAELTYAENNTETCGRMSEELRETAESVLSEIPDSADDFEKVLAIHDYIIDRCEYKDGDFLNLTAYGCLVNGDSICSGYAQAFDYLAKAAGLKSVVVTGISNDEAHSWNQVLVDGEWYNIDVTWDDAGIQHANFLCDDTSFNINHFADENEAQPFECSCDINNYYKKYDLFIEDFDDADRILNREIAKQSGYIELRLADSDLYSDFVEIYISQEQRIFDFFRENDLDSDEISLTEEETHNYIRIDYAI